MSTVQEYVHGWMRQFYYLAGVRLNPVCTIIFNFKLTACTIPFPPQKYLKPMQERHLWDKIDDMFMPEETGSDSGQDVRRNNLLWRAQGIKINTA